MKIKKTILDSIDKCYACTIHKTPNSLRFIGASEGDGCCHAIENGEKTSLWENVGGTMNIIPIPNKENCYLATRKFLPVFNSRGCELNFVEKKGNEWNLKVLQNIPYLHRFDIFEKNGKCYFFGATLCEAKEFQQDWSKPGSVFVGQLNDFNSPISLREIFKGITKNHGLWREQNFEKGDSFLVSGTEGVFSFTIPENPMTDDWAAQNILQVEVSDVALCDICGDGTLALGTIEGFHGNTMNIYRKNHRGYEKIFTKDIEFGHVLWGGEICGENAFVLGYRRGKMELGIVRFNQVSLSQKEFTFQKIDENVGPSQISVHNENGKTTILSANRQINELAVYELTK